MQHGLKVNFVLRRLARIPQFYGTDRIPVERDLVKSVRGPIGQPYRTTRIQCHGDPPRTRPRVSEVEGVTGPTRYGRLPGNHGTYFHQQGLLLLRFARPRRSKPCDTVVRLRDRPALRPPAPNPLVHGSESVDTNNDSDRLEPLRENICRPARTRPQAQSHHATRIAIKLDAERIEHQLLMTVTDPHSIGWLPYDSALTIPVAHFPRSTAVAGHAQQVSTVTTEYSNLLPSDI